MQVDLAAWGKSGTISDWVNDLYSGDSDLIRPALDAIFFTRVYTSDPANPNNLSSSAYYEAGFDTGDNGNHTIVLGGHIVNPAGLTLKYQNTANHNLSTSQHFTGQLPNGTYLVNYYLTSSPLFTLAPPADPQSPTPTEQQAISEAFASYYRLGDEVTIAPPAIEGYITPSVQSFRLTSADIEASYTYESVGGSETIDDDENQSTTDYKGTNRGLAETGFDRNLLFAISSAIILLGLAMLALLRIRRKAH